MPLAIQIMKKHMENDYTIAAYGDPNPSIQIMRTLGPEGLHILLTRGYLDD